MNDLFSSCPAPNVLPYDGMSVYLGPVLAEADAAAFFTELRDGIPWRQEEVVLFGKRILTARKVAWFGDEPYAYAYSGSSKTALPWTDEVRDLKSRVEAASGEVFNSCLLNFYHDGKDGMGGHSDDERTLEPEAAIASVSLGACRKFRFKHKRTGETVSLMLENGSLLVMKGRTQSHWLHCLPKSAVITQPRINLTFRRMRQGH